MSEQQKLRDLVSELEKMEAYLSKVNLKDPSLRTLILKLRQDMLGLMPFIDVYRIVHFEEEEEE